MVTSPCSIDGAVSTRIAKANASFERLLAGLQSVLGIKAQTKLSVYKAAVVTIYCIGVKHGLCTGGIYGQWVNSPFIASRR